MAWCNALFAFTFFAFVSGVATANTYDMYRADYEKGAFCAAIAGACASDINPENSFFTNPAALESGKPGLYFDADYSESTQSLEPGMNTSNTYNSTSFMAGIAYAGNVFGWGIAARGRDVSVTTNATFFDSGNNPHFVVTTDWNRTIFINMPMAIKLSKTLSVGFSVSGLLYSEDLQVTGAPDTKTTQDYKLPDLGGSFGILWSPSKSFRFGTWIASTNDALVNQDINISPDGIPINDSEDLDLHMPWREDTGISIMPWADRRTIFLDLDLIGNTPGGFERTLDTFSFAANQTGLRAKGRNLTLEPHLAWRSPWPWSMKSNGEYSLGTYYENSRWEGIPGRIHGVAGLSYKLGPIEFLIAIDVAPRNYLNLLFSFR